MNLSCPPYGHARAPEGIDCLCEHNFLYNVNRCSTSTQRAKHTHLHIITATGMTACSKQQIYYSRDAFVFLANGLPEAFRFSGAALAACVGTACAARSGALRTICTHVHIEALSHPAACRFHPPKNPGGVPILGLFMIFFGQELQHLNTSI